MSFPFAFSLFRVFAFSSARTFAFSRSLAGYVGCVQRERRAAMEKVRCGVIGVGGMGSGHCQMMGQIPEVELAAVCDAVPEVSRAVADQYGVRGFTRHEELLDSGLVDMVIIATPHYFHPPIAEAAFERGLHVLSEKPIAVSVSEADRMICAARASGKKFGVMFQMRTSSRNRAAKRLIDEGRLGGIYRASLTMGWYRTQA